MKNRIDIGDKLLPIGAVTHWHKPLFVALIHRGHVYAGTSPVDQVHGPISVAAAKESPYFAKRFCPAVKTVAVDTYTWADCEDVVSEMKAVVTRLGMQPYEAYRFLRVPPEDALQVIQHFKDAAGILAKTRGANGQ